ncbi:hypothetical protein, partial [Escherichia coli]|uniref:hypothetical protein n=1 Tax=Escherichia coli TaxID=562 RepID=UPI001953FD95
SRGSSIALAMGSDMNVINFISNLTEMISLIMYFGIGIFAAWFIWTDRKITKLSIPATLALE